MEVADVLHPFDRAAAMSQSKAHSPSLVLFACAREQCDNLDGNGAPQQGCRFRMRAVKQLRRQRDPARVGVATMQVEAMCTRCSAGHHKRSNGRTLFVKADQHVRNIPS
jgi:hypothetical protein